MRHFASCVSIALGCLLTAAMVHAQPSRNSAPVPRVVRITGAFVPANGQPIGPVETVTLAIYADESGGAPLWQETQTITVDAAGRYTVLLGASENDGLPMELFASGEARWLGRHFDRPGEQEQARILLASVPYALKAADADTLGGRPASAYVVAGNTRSVRGGNITSAEESVVGPLDTFPGSVNAVPKYVTTTDLGISSIFDIGGLVGVGTASPVDAMHLKFTNTTGTMTGLAVQNLGSTASSYSGMLFYDQNGALGQFQGFNNSTHEYRINNVASSGSINFMVGGSSKLRVGNNGHIGIGTTTPFGGERVSIDAGAARGIEVDTTADFGLVGNTVVAGDTGGTAVLGQAGTGKGVWAFSSSGIPLYVSGGGSAQAAFVGSGSVGIGTGSPADKLQVTGDIRVGTGTTGCVKDADATVIAGTCSSDRRFKQQIAPLASSLEKVARLQPVTFRWRDDAFPDKHFGQNPSFGLIAQDVEAVLPELVTTDDDGYKAIKYNLLPFHMLQAIKDLKSENDDLKARLAALESALATLMKR